MTQAHALDEEFAAAKSSPLNLEQLSERVSLLVEQKAPPSLWLMVAIGTMVVGLLAASLSLVTGRGIGVWGNDQTVGWACDISGFVFWIGIGHAGTLISAILFLFRQRWRTTINRAAEAMTLFAVMAAAIYPVFHLGRVWLGYWLLPAPNQMLVWPNFKSPLTWDVFAISTYFLVSLIFWYLGLIPDLAQLRDRAQFGTRKRVLSRLSLGWNGSQRDWQYYERAYLTLAGLATPLVVSVHTIVSFDFAVAVLPGWHSTLFPPYFVAGAILSGSAWVGALLVLVRDYCGLKDAITVRHIEKLNQLVLATGTLVGGSYLIEFYLGFAGEDAFEKAVLLDRLLGAKALPFAVMVGCNVLLPQLYWFSKLRRSLVATVVIGIGVNIGMWFERYVIVTGSLERSFLPSTLSRFTPTAVDIAMLVGTIGLFFTLFLLFLRYVPVLSLHELRSDRHLAETEIPDSHRAGAAPFTAKATVEDSSDTDPTLIFRGWPVEARKRGMSTSQQPALDPSVQVVEVRSSHEARSSHGTTDSSLHRAPKLSLLRGAPASNESVTSVVGLCRDLPSLLGACEQLQAMSPLQLDVYAPYPIHETHRYVAQDSSRIALSALLGGCFGASLAIGLQYYAQVIGYPLALGNHAAWSWQFAVPVTFEVAVLFAALGCFFSFLRACGLPATHDSAMDACLTQRSGEGRLVVRIECGHSDVRKVVSLLEHGNASGVAEAIK